MTNAPLRVLHILHSMNRGGAENALMNYYRCIDRDKVQFDFLLTDPEKCDFEDEIKSLGGKVYRVPLLTIKHPMRYISSVRRFFKEHPEYLIAHSHTSSKSVVPLAIAKFSHIPVRIAHSHNSMSETGVNGLIRNALKPLLKVTANEFFSCGRQAAVWLYGRKMGESGKVRIIPNVIHADRFRYNADTREAMRKKLGIGTGAFVIGHVARFCEEKNHIFSIEILNEALKRNPDSYLLLVGDGPEHDSIKAYADKLGVSGNVRMTGVVSNVYDYEQAMDAFILPSFYEGLPLSIVEAQVSGLPCFTTKGTVSTECSVTDLVEYLPLEAGAKVWADEIFKAAANERTDRFEEIRAAGYDSASAADALQNHYLELSRNWRK